MALTFTLSEEETSHEATRDRAMMYRKTAVVSSGTSV